MAFFSNREEPLTASAKSIRVCRISETHKPIRSRILGKPWKVIAKTDYLYNPHDVAYSSSGATIATSYRSKIFFLEC